jgi:hypothetical protein
MVPPDPPVLVTPPLPVLPALPPVLLEPLPPSTPPVPAPAVPLLEGSGGVVSIWQPTAESRAADDAMAHAQTTGRRLGGEVEAREVFCMVSDGVRTASTKILKSFARAPMNHG